MTQAMKDHLVSEHCPVHRSAKNMYYLPCVATGNNEIAVETFGNLLYLAFFFFLLNNSEKNISEFAMK